MSILGSVTGMGNAQEVSLTAAQIAERQIAALTEGLRQELAERERDGDPYNEGYMDALDGCVKALELIGR